ncbi:putative aspartyl/asparaginyl beta-hydroxylase (Aspartate beta-hydroxylase) (Peptide-aspartate beta-dioxygenase) [Desulforapulum autotrophicum HRM2]|uniref:Aspartyl/asparaginyl beta-hydroxylase (Aspartate beta-hydroxylase) (Peptide-aspartate beta-dioxygenase) n=1 Tax=Desulforapulum autotrophicum (strain ATCC 43914 / DSM 3382 / VKM B-1955 / HRM2) TaxID=177437 RepID=C0QKP7_DESAH|nr:tol-pal system protein YbgF [Desulforapulum autotrophicum]ACN16137.1 putative aspartyl/asparaginyl beta-hydroxylase (Aspartate beta-hydroxylase) (Peptide-aspartate beta-dioxygenase) [Desulforapulum autotrophicum HRM2]
MTNKFFFILCLPVLFLVSGCVSTQELSMLENRVAVLESQDSDRFTREDKTIKEMTLVVNRLESGLEESQRTSREGYAELKSLVEEIKAENQQLTGRMEESEHRFKNVGNQASAGSKTDFVRLDAAVSKNFQRIVALEEYLGFEPSDVKVDAPPVDGEKTVEDTSEKGLYSAAKLLLDKGEFEQARKAFEAFLKPYPESDNADNARFWIAESYYREKWYEKAILEYQKVIENYPKGNKVSAALFKQGYAFANLGEKANARLILKELIKKFPQSNEAGIAAEKLKSLQ